jgi:hypothetical protein
LKSILVFSHKHNSLNKEKLLESPEMTKTIPSKYTVDDFIKDPDLKKFYMYDMNQLLEKYEPGKPEHKPKLLEQIKKMEDERAKRIDDHNSMLKAQQQILSSLPKPNMNNDLIEMKRNYDKQIADKNYIISELLKKIKLLNQEVDKYKLNTTLKL